MVEWLVLANPVTLVMFVVGMLLLGLVLVACDNRQCTDGAQRIETTNDVFLCIAGRWKRQDNPYEPPIKA